jgi:protoporphyrinogen oxidase
VTQGNEKTIAILGAGLSGLRLGSHLAGKGFQVEIYDKNDFAGGLLQTIEKDGFYLDLGPRILTGEHLDFYKELLGSDLLTKQVFSGIGYERRQIRSPIDPLETVSTLKPGDSILMALDMATRMLLGREADHVENADQWASTKFGKRANECFFKYYIEKCTGVPANKVSAHWGTEQYSFDKERTLVERSKKMLSRVFKESERQAPEIHHPRKGAQMIAKKLAERIEQNGGKIFLKSKVVAIVSSENRVERVIIEASDGQKRDVSADLFVSTLPITDLWDMLLGLGPDADSESEKLTLDYRSLWLFYFRLNRPRLMDKIQIYFPEEHYYFKRIYEPKNLDPQMGDPGTTMICVEVGYTEGDAVSKMIEDKLAERLISEISDFYFLNPADFIDHFSVKVPYSFPVYELGYIGQVLKAAKLVYGFDNLFAIGRQGLFRNDYMMNRVMESADYLAKFLQSGKMKKEFLREPIAKALFF